ncbi:MAG: acyl-CoA thioesterase [Calditrichota bacterium]
MPKSRINEVLNARKPEEVRSWELVFPNDANPLGSMFGGRVMAIMDKIAGIAAGRFAGMPVVTASTEAIDFKLPIRVGDRIETVARVVWVGKTSIVVKVGVYAEDPQTLDYVLCTSAHFNFVALDRNGKPTRVPEIIVETEDDKQDYKVAEFVKKQALERRKELG